MERLENTEVVQLNFKYTEQEYLAAARLFLWRSKETLIRLVVSYTLISFGLILLSLIELGLSLWFTISLILFVGAAFFHGFIFDLPRRYFRGDLKFRDEYNLSFSDQGIGFNTRSINASVAWSLYTEVIEDKSFYLLIYGKNIGSVTIIPKRVFRDSKQGVAFRALLHRHIDQNLSVKQLSSEDSCENTYVPSSLEPPDWR
ncbi:MAG: YcxB family protein [Pyrinomonadaceae bacterium]|nr:YcxB family protein [Pyrinomonadaceae bacterium]